MLDVRVFNALKAFLMKESFDFSRPDIDLYNFHPQLRLFLAPMGIFFNNENSLLRFVWPFLSVSLSIIADVFEMIFVFHGIEIEDYAFATECFCYLILLGVIPPVYGSMMFNRSNVLKILEDMDKDFKFICNLEAKYREHFLKGQLFIWQLCFIWLWFTSIIAIMYGAMTFVPLLYLSLFATQDEHMIRPLIFPMWLPEDDPYRTPNYEIFFFLQLNFCFMFIQTFSVYVYIQFHMLLHNYYVLELAILHFKVLFEGLDETVAYLPPDNNRRLATQRTLNSRMRKIVNWHNSVFKSIAMISKVQGAPLVYQVMFSSVAVCLMMYQIADKLDGGVFDILFFMLFVATTIQLWIPCFLGTILMNKISNSATRMFWPLAIAVTQHGISYIRWNNTLLQMAYEVGDACWNCGWHETSLGRLLRMDIIIVILRAQQPLSIKFTGLPTLSLETFSSNMSSAYSYFNMLRQYN